MSQEVRVITYIVVGDVTVGKTILLVTYASGQYPEVRKPSIFSDPGVTVTVDDTEVDLRLIDTPGHEDYSRLRPLSYPTADMFLICFSIVNPDSFDNVSKIWIPEVRHHRPGAPVILVGTKLDQREDSECLAELAAKGLSPITLEQGHKLASEIHAYKYLECSARTQQGLKEVFDEAVRSVINSTPTKKKKKSCVLI